jgi:3-hydroxybutyryl-CoA dehydrogenase
MRYVVLSNGESRTFPADGSLRTGAASCFPAEVAIYLRSAQMALDPSLIAILIELGDESLGQHTGEALGEEGSNIVGFARYSNGDDTPSNLVEIVRQKNTNEDAIAAARTIFEAAGLQVVICTDQPGRIVDRLVRPKYNAALRFLDEGLATQADIDLTCRLGLGYPDGPIERVVRGDLARHYEITQSLFEIFGGPGFAPARRAVVAARRKESGR